MQQQILLIDDSGPIHALVKSLLGEEPVEIHSAYDADAGMVLAASLRPDLILLDVEMPGQNGFQVCKKLKADPATAAVPIVFLTACATVEEMVKGLNLGASDYVTKPFKLSELLSRVRATLRTSRMIRLLEEKAMIDAITGLGNRSMFNSRLAAEVGLRIRTGNSLSCILLDVDHFKLINDRYSRPFGDHVLGKVGECLTHIRRVEDVVCRHHADKFVVLAPHTSADEAAPLAERMRESIERIPFFRQNSGLVVTCSIGISEALDTYDRAIMERASVALYESKKHGRNRVTIHADRAAPRKLAA